MFKVIYCALLCCLALDASLAAPSSKIVGGFNAERNQFPHQISLRNSGSHNCGGSVISATYVVTAAHCVDDSRPQNYEVVAGALGLTEKGQRRSVKRIISHEKYADFKNDIALIELNEPLVFDDSVQPIAVATSEVPVGSEVLISGWGRIYNGGPLPEVLKYNYVTVESQQICGQVSGIFYDGLLCFGHPRDNGACNGDSGGPAIFNNELVGIANFVIGGCGTSYPDGYAKVSFFNDWLNEKMSS